MRRSPPCPGLEPRPRFRLLERDPGPYDADRRAAMMVRRHRSGRNSRVISAPRRGRALRQRAASAILAQSVAQSCLSVARNYRVCEKRVYGRRHETDACDGDRPWPWPDRRAPGRAQTLEEALVAAYLTNPDLEAQRAALRATDELVPQALSDWRPTVAIDGSSDRQRRCRQLGTGTARSTPRRPRSRSISRSTAAAKPSPTPSAPRTWFVSERARLVAFEQNVLLDAVDGVHQPARRRGGARFRDPEREPAAPSAAGDPDRFEVGEVTRTDVAQADARAVGRDRRSRAGRGRADRRQGGLSARDQSGAGPAGGAGAAARVAGQRSGGAAARRRQQPEHHVGAVRSGGRARRCRCRAVGVAAAAFG